MTRRKIVAVIGGSAQTCSEEDRLIAYAVGKLLVDNGYRLVTGGYGGVMEEASRGAHDSGNYRDGDVIGIIAGDQSKDANQYCDIVIATGIGFARNQIITATGDVIVAIGGGSGTLSEIAFAWQLNKPIFGFNLKGWSGKLAGTQLDAKRTDTIIPVNTPENLIKLIKKLLP